MNALKASPRTKQKAARTILRRSAVAASAPATPHNPHPSICQGVHEPCPRKKFDTNAAIAPTAKPLLAPSVTPATTAITVTGCTPGNGANSTRPAAAAAPSVAIRTRCFEESGPRSNHATPVARSAKTSSNSDSPSCAWSSALQRAAANAAVPANSKTPLDKDSLPPERHGAVRNGVCELLVVRHDERRSPARLGT